MNVAFEEENKKFDEEFDIRVSCGLDHGRIILLEGEDFFGNAVNIASKLGEDIASAGEILVADTAMEALPEEEKFEHDLLTFSISGLTLEAAKILGMKRPAIVFCCLVFCSGWHRARLRIAPKFDGRAASRSPVSFRRSMPMFSFCRSHAAGGGGFGKISVGRGDQEWAEGGSERRVSLH